MAYCCFASIYSETLHLENFVDCLYALAYIAKLAHFKLG